MNYVIHSDKSSFMGALTPDSYPSRDVTDPREPSVGKVRVHRGGCYLVESIKCRSAARNWDPPGDTYYYLGFRVVMEARK
jgi:formylglycine-generating enzyme required for sulfatase activity